MKNNLKLNPKFLFCLIFVITICVMATFFIQNKSYANEQKIDASVNHQITQQPSDITVTCPSDGSFSVAVSDEDQVESYEWWYSNDTSVAENKMDGFTAKTNNLYFPCVKQEYDGLYFVCFIKYKDGTELQSRFAKITVTNPLEDVKLLYICEYAILPGQTLDLSETNLGSGTINFKDPENIIVSNVNFNNYHKIFTTSVFDVAPHPISNGPLLYYDDLYNNIHNINVIFEGKNTIFNAVNELEGNEQGGLVIDFYCKYNGKLLTLNIKGMPNSSLQMTGGDCFIINNGDLNIEDMNINIKSLPNNRSEKYGAITSYNSSLEETTIDKGLNINNSNFSFDRNGGLLHSDGKTNIESSTIDAKCVSATKEGGTKGGFKPIYSFDALSTNNSDIKIITDEKRAVSKGLCFATSMIESGNYANFANSKFDLRYTADELSICNQVFAISCPTTHTKEHELKNLVFTNCDINAEIGSDNYNILVSGGIKGGAEDQEITIDNTKFKYITYASSFTKGITSNENILIKNSDIDLCLNQSDIYETSNCEAISSPQKILIDLNRPDDKITYKINAPKDKNAIGLASILPKTDKLTSLEYNPQKIFLQGKAKLDNNLCFGKFKVNIEGVGNHNYYETLMNIDDDSHPAYNAKIYVEADNPVNPSTDTDKSNTTQTGDYWYLFLVALMILAISSTAVYIKRNQ